MNMVALVIGGLGIITGLLLTASPLFGFSPGYAIPGIICLVIGIACAWPSKERIGGRTKK